MEADKEGFWDGPEVAKYWRGWVRAWGPELYQGCPAPHKSLPDSATMDLKEAASLERKAKCKGTIQKPLSHESPSSAAVGDPGVLCWT
jgi:hypothetical protein